MAERVCARDGCGQMFTPKRPEQRFCGVGCGNSFRQQPKPEPVTRVCARAICGVTFTVPRETSPALHCSVRCGVRARVGEVVRRRCAWPPCGRELVAATKTQRYCDRACGALAVAATKRQARQEALAR